jgi:hypothetical protein
MNQVQFKDVPDSAVFGAMGDDTLFIKCHPHRGKSNAMQLSAVDTDPDDPDGDDGVFSPAWFADDAPVQYPIPPHQRDNALMNAFETARDMKQFAETVGGILTEVKP